MSKRDSFEGFWSDVIEDVLDGLEKHDDTFHDIVLGEVEPSNLEYPTVHVLPDVSNYQGDQTYQDVVRVFFYFEKGRDDPRQYLESVRSVESAVDDALLELYKDEVVGNHKVGRFEHYSGEMANTLLEIVSVDIRISKLFNYSPDRS